jgi:hypothetical protein
MADMYEADLADLVWIATVTLCDDSRVEHLEHRSKTDKFILGPFTTFAQFLLTTPRISCSLLMSRVPEEEQTGDVCAAIVAKSPFSIQYVRKQSAPLCMRAVQLNPDTIQCIRELTTDLCLVAVRAKGLVLQHIPDSVQTTDICRAAVSVCPDAKRFVAKRLRSLV